MGPDSGLWNRWEGGVTPGSRHSLGCYHVLGEDKRVLPLVSGTYPAGLGASYRIWVSRHRTVGAQLAFSHDWGETFLDAR